MPADAAAARSSDTTASEAEAASDLELIDLAARFARGFGRILDGKQPGGLAYPHLRVLETLHCQGPSTMRPIAERLGLSARNLTAVADSLEGDGLVRRSVHPHDRRATILELTDEGHAAADTALSPRVGEIMALFQRLAPADVERFRRILAELVEAMEAGCPSDPCADPSC